MRAVRYLAMFHFVAFANSVWAQPGLEQVYRQANLSKSNSFEVNVQNILEHVQRNLDRENDEVDQLEVWVQQNDIAAIRKAYGTKISEEMYRGGVSHLLGDLDMSRTIHQALDKDGKMIASGCRTSALLFSELLAKSGVNPKSIYLIETVEENDYRKICPRTGADASKSNETLPLGGHVFVLVRVSDTDWRLFNPRRSFDANNRGAGHKFSSPDDINSFPWLLRIPSEMNPYQKDRGDLLIFSARSLREVPSYKLSQRLNLVASGTTSSSICKKSPPPKTLESEAPQTSN